MGSKQLPERESYSGNLTGASYEEYDRKATAASAVGPLFCTEQNGSLTTLSGSSSAVERQLPKL
ncbi:MAG: hypothetical protein WBW01_03900, partial [Terriglobales bacterium]